MLQNCDVPAGQVVSVAISIVHFCEQMLYVSMLNELVHTWLAHSVDVSLTVTHLAPNGRFVAGASGVGVEPLQAASTTASKRCLIMTAMLPCSPHGRVVSSAADR